MVVYQGTYPEQAVVLTENFLLDTILHMETRFVVFQSILIFDSEEDYGRRQGNIFY